MKLLSDPDAERAALACVIKYGNSIYTDFQNIEISDNTFTIDSHKVIYKCIQKIFLDHENISTLDISLIYSAATDLGIKSWFHRDDEVSYLNNIFNYPVKEDNAKIFGLKIKKLEIARNINNRLEDAQEETLSISGTEDINDIFSIVEKTLLDCGSLLSNQNKSATKLSAGMKEYFDDLEKNPIEQIGISTGFPVFDKAIGGGLRDGSVDVIAARMGIGKSSLGMNIAINISKLDIPVLILDSEMKKEDAWTRSGACLSQLSNNLIETGQYSKFSNNINKVHSAINEIEKLPIFYESISGLNIENQVAIIKKWLIKEVGIKKSGIANKAVVIYDYLKLMNAEQGKGFEEYQMMGFIITTLVNLAQKYKIPILSFIQLNRDGINKEDSSVIATSDRIAWFCSSLSLFKPKEIEEIEQDGYENGNRKLMIIKSRFGPGLVAGDYINMNFNGSISRITEGKTKFEIYKNKKQIAKMLNKDESDEKVAF